ncbi:MAG: tetratricopeptide repeat protein [Candidatus Hydrogenedentes bacterium]|nr:tetratricopeptide repeat protein [Candidatus Hydrogenedentota bacterium]
MSPGAIDEPGKDKEGTDASAPAPNPDSEASQTLLDQSELDAVMALVAKQRAEAKAKKKALESQLATPPPPPPPVQVEKANLGPVKQAELDNVLAQRDEPPKEAAAEMPAKVVAQETPVKPAQEPAPPPPPQPAKPQPTAVTPARPVGQNEIDALMRGEIDRLLATVTPPVQDAKPADNQQDAIVDQDEVDRLLAAMSAPAPPKQEPPVTPPPAKEPEAQLSTTLDQDEIDRMLASAKNLERRDSEVVQKAHERAETAASHAAAPMPTGGTLSQEEIDNLLHADATDVPLDNSDMDAPIVPSGVESPVSMDAVIGPTQDDAVLAQEDVDSLLSQIGATSMTQPDEDDAILVDPVDRAIRANAMESVSLENLAAAVPSKDTDDSILSQDLIDSLLAQASQTAPKPPAEPVSASAPSEKEVSALDEISIPSSEELTSHPPAGAGVVETSGAVHLSDSDMADMGFAPVATPSEAPSRRAEDSEEKPKETGVVARLRITRTPWPRPGLKEWTAIAAGLALAVASFFFFSSKMEPSVPVAESTEQHVETQQPIQEAEATPQEPTQEVTPEAHPEESQTHAELPPEHTTPVAETPETPETHASAPSAEDARYREIETAYRELPKSPKESEVDKLQEDIDTFLASSPNFPNAPEMLRWKAELYERTNLPMAALDVYKQILDQYSAASGQDATLLAMGKVYMSIKRPEQAAGVLQELQDKYPGSPLLQDARLLMGDSQLALGKRDEARRLYTQVAMGEPNTYQGSVAYGKLGDMEVEDGRFGEAIKLLEARLEVATSTEGHEHIYMTLANAYKHSGRLPEAEKTLRELIDFFPESELAPKAYVELSRVLDQAGRRPEALRVATYAKNRFPEDGELLRNYSAMQSLVGDEKAAAQGLVEGIRSGDRTPGILLSAAKSLGKIGDFEEARFNLDQLMSLYPTSPEAFDGQILLAQLLYKNGDAIKALENLDEMEQLYARKPQRLPIYTARGGIYKDLGLAEKAAGDFEKAAELTTESSVLAECAEALFEAGIYGSGFAAASRVDPEKLPDQDAYNFLVSYGKALFNGRTDTAVAKLEDAANNYPDLRTKEGDQALLRAYMETGKEAAARVLVANIESRSRRDLTKLADLQEAALMLGEHFFQRGDYRAAADTYELAADPRVPDSADDVAWAKYQRANALLLADNPKQSLALFKEVGASESRWSEDAKLKAQFIELALKLRLPISLASAAHALPEPTPPRAETQAGQTSQAPPNTQEPATETGG